MSRVRKYTCGVPKQFCNGTHSMSCFGIRGILESQRKVHGSREEAFNCRARWLVEHEGYTQIGSREFSKDGGPILVLSKKSKFGGELRAGKSLEGKGNRVMPSGKGNGGMIAGY